jgi:RimJ/RimL family protein N-acetyltransferase
MLSPWRLATARLVMSPVAPADLREIAALKADPRAFGQMLGGVRSRLEAAEELADDIRAWGADGFGMWTVRAREGNSFLGLTGLMHRPDHRGVALRFAFWPQARGVGLATEAAGAALVYAHETVMLPRVVAVAREDNFASRMVIGAIGMTQADSFTRNGILLLVYHSTRNIAADADRRHTQFKLG